MEYPKIETLYDRDPQTFKVIPGKLRMEEFGIVNRWYVTEQIDGTNVRVMWDAEKRQVRFGGRTGNAQMPVFLMEYLAQTFHPSKFDSFTADVILFGEGYGERIQKGGGNYRKGVSFRLFDAFVDRKWWLEPDNLKDVADALGCAMTPVVSISKFLPQNESELDMLATLEKYRGKSLVSIEDGGAGCRPEGIVARSYPLLLSRSGKRIMWKLKYKDF